MTTTPATTAEPAGTCETRPEDEGSGSSVAAPEDVAMGRGVVVVAMIGLLTAVPYLVLAGYAVYATAIYDPGNRADGTFQTVAGYVIAGVVAIPAVFIIGLVSYGLVLRRRHMKSAWAMTLSGAVIGWMSLALYVSRVLIGRLG